jgi:hypothetical protein
MLGKREEKLAMVGQVSEIFFSVVWPIEDEAFPPSQRLKKEGVAELDVLEELPLD